MHEEGVGSPRFLNTDSGSFVAGNGPTTPYQVGDLPDLDFDPEALHPYAKNHLNKEISLANTAQTYATYAAYVGLAATVSGVAELIHNRRFISTGFTPHVGNKLAFSGFTIMLIAGLIALAASSFKEHWLTVNQFHTHHPDTIIPLTENSNTESAAVEDANTTIVPNKKYQAALWTGNILRATSCAALIVTAGFTADMGYKIIMQDMSIDKVLNENILGTHHNLHVTSLFALIAVGVAALAAATDFYIRYKIEEAIEAQPRTIQTLKAPSKTMSFFNPRGLGMAGIGVGAIGIYDGGNLPTIMTGVILTLSGFLIQALLHSQRMSQSEMTKPDDADNHFSSYQGPIALFGVGMIIAGACAKTKCLSLIFSGAIFAVPALIGIILEQLGCDMNTAATKKPNTPQNTKGQGLAYATAAAGIVIASGTTFVTRATPPITLHSTDMYLFLIATALMVAGTIMSLVGKEQESTANAHNNKRRKSSCI